MIYGGTKYGVEVSDRIKKFGRLLVDLKRKNRLIKLDDSRVDVIAADLKIIVPDERFDDEHIAAMVIVSKCCVVCTDDIKSLPYLRDRKLYPKGTKAPNVYHTQADAGFCCDKYLAKICLPRAVRGFNTRKPKARPRASSNYLGKRR